MKNKTSIRELLQSIFQEKTGKEIDLWPRLAQSVSSPARSKHTTNTVRLSFALVIVLAISAYAFVRIMLDPGLQGVNDAGLVKNIVETAYPTTFDKSSQKINVTLNWAYADENRLAFQLLISGFSAPEGMDLRDVICDPYIRDSEGISLGNEGGKSQLRVNETLPNSPIEATYVYQQQINSKAHENLNVMLDLTLGPCNSSGNGGVEDMGNNPLQATPMPLIGNYRIEFQVPIAAGINVPVNQLVEQSGVRLRLTNLMVSPSYINARFCIDNIDSGVQFSNAVQSDDWLAEAKIKIGDSEEISSARFFGENMQGEICGNLGFEVAYLKQDQIILTIDQLNAISSEDISIHGPWVFEVTPK